ncbi:GIN domain-containing protein [Pseudomonas sp. HLT2-19-2]
MTLYDLHRPSSTLESRAQGTIDAYVSNSVKARVAGSGDIVIRGNPPIRDHSVAGSGDIKFKK